ncbi:hypothetical protein TNCT_448351, partial [Trichonephila clavata]
KSLTILTDSSVLSHLHELSNFTFQYLPACLFEVEQCAKM